MPDTSHEEVILQVSGLKKLFPLRKGLALSGAGEKNVCVRAVDGVDFQITDGEILGVVGESGCGKTTLGKLLVRLHEPSEGQILFRGNDITHLSKRRMKPFRRQMQIVFQDPFSSLPVRMTASEILVEPLRIHKIVSTNEEGVAEASRLLEDVGLVPTEVFLSKHPNQLSGGQRQRLSIARAIALKPKFIVADEPVSMLDLSIRAGILNLIRDLKREHGLTVLLITHDLASAQYMCDRIAIMYVGNIVELGPGKEILRNPFHPYTRLLKAALPRLDPVGKHHLDKLPTEKEAANPIDIPSGCRFHPRCIYCREICKTDEPELRTVDGRQVACHAVNDWLPVDGQ